MFRINPVLGCYEPPKPNPFECMSVEQQEHEVMQLVSKMDKLTRYKQFSYNLNCPIIILNLFYFLEKG